MVVFCLCYIHVKLYEKLNILYSIKLESFLLYITLNVNEYKMRETRLGT